jgi:hypothetical protein
MVIRAPTDLQLEAYARTCELRKLVMGKGEHYDPYIEKFQDTANASRDLIMRSTSTTRAAGAHAVFSGGVPTACNAARYANTIAGPRVVPGPGYVPAMTDPMSLPQA